MGRFILWYLLPVASPHGNEDNLPANAVGADLHLGMRSCCSLRNILRLVGFSLFFCFYIFVSQLFSTIFAVLIPASQKPLHISRAIREMVKYVRLCCFVCLRH